MKYRKVNKIKILIPVILIIVRSDVVRSGQAEGVVVGSCQVKSVLSNVVFSRSQFMSSHVRLGQGKLNPVKAS